MKLGGQIMKIEKVGKGTQRMCLEGYGLGYGHLKFALEYELDSQEGPSCLPIRE